MHAAIASPTRFGRAAWTRSRRWPRSRRATACAAISIPARRAGTRPLLEGTDLRKQYQARAGMLAALHRRTRSVPAGDGVRLGLSEPETLALVREARFGETTSRRIVLP